jgi:hypothetical protein
MIGSAQSDFRIGIFLGGFGFTGSPLAEVPDTRVTGSLQLCDSRASK